MCTLTTRTSSRCSIAGQGHLQQRVSSPRRSTTTRMNGTATPKLLFEKRAPGKGAVADLGGRRGWSS
eukprot:16268553-Heterocapsa_arctica.AAC.1